MQKLMSAKSKKLKAAYKSNKIQVKRIGHRILLYGLI